MGHSIHSKSSSTAPPCRKSVYIHSDRRSGDCRCTSKSRDNMSGMLSIATPCAHRKSAPSPHRWDKHICNHGGTSPSKNGVSGRPQVSLCVCVRVCVPLSVCPTAPVPVSVYVCVCMLVCIPVCLQQCVTRKMQHRGSASPSGRSTVTPSMQTCKTQNDRSIYRDSSLSTRKRV